MIQMRGLLGILAVILLLSPAYAAHYSASIFAPAVVTVDNGTLTQISVNITSGNGQVRVEGPKSVGSSTLESAQTAAAYAFSYLGMNQAQYNVIYFINATSTSVSGPSAGLAFTLLAVSALSGRTLDPSMTVTGTINSTGGVGLIGGVYDKGSAAHDRGLRFMLVPAAQNGSFEQLLYYITQQNNNITLSQVSNLSDALPYAFGQTAPVPQTFSYAADYYLASLPASNVSCTICNTTLPYFIGVTSSTANFTLQEVQAIPPQYSAAKESLLAQLDNDTAVAGKGYFYASADLAFHESSVAFALLNSQVINYTGVDAAVTGIQSTCTGLTPPPLTDQNYEFVFGGEMRQQLGMVNANISLQLLNTAETEDDQIEALYTLAPSYSWCEAASRMYAAAAQIGGTPVGYASGTPDEVEDMLATIPYVNQSIYSEAAKAAYQNGEYGAALYALDYYNTSSNLPIITNPAELRAKTLADIANATYGVWPSQTAGQAQFYLYEAGFENQTAANATLQGAYFSAALADSLARTNEQFTSTYTYNTTPITPPPGVQTQINSLSSSIQQLYQLLLLLLIVVIVIVIIQLVHLTHSIQAHKELKGQPPKKQRRRNARGA